MKRLAVLTFCAVMFVASVLPGMAQGTPESNHCTPFQTYWETLVSTVPNDPQGKALFEVFLESDSDVAWDDDELASISSFLTAWEAHLKEIPSTDVPEHVELFHEQTVDMVSTAQLVFEGYARTGQINTPGVITYRGLGTFMLLLTESETPAVCT